MTDRPTIAVVGAGRMGRGIAQVFAYGGHDVRLIDLKGRPAAASDDLLQAARDEIAGNLALLASLDVLPDQAIPSILDRIHGHAANSAVAALADAALVFEAVPEVLATKEKALGVIASHLAPDAILSSTTSTILVDTLAAFVPDPSRFLNAHWLNPAYLIPLVEVSPGNRTDEAAVARLMALLEGVGKVPVRCKAAPGFIVPRIQAVAMNEAARMVEEGVATAEDIDRAIRVGFGPRYTAMGLVEFIDWGGVDILYHASHYLSAALDDPRYTPPAIVDRLMASGHMGMREGRGFYDFRGRDMTAYQRETLERFVTLLRAQGLLPSHVDV